MYSCGSCVYSCITTKQCTGTGVLMCLMCVLVCHNKEVYWCWCTHVSLNEVGVDNTGYAEITIPFVLLVISAFA